jgi:hypothetical protein
MTLPGSDCSTSPPEDAMSLRLQTAITAIAVPTSADVSSPDRATNPESGLAPTGHAVNPLAS